MKIYDCFTFFNELDLLEFRLKLLNDYVDYFVIAEANITHSGEPKELNFEKNKERFANWMHKIIYIPAILNTIGLDLSKQTESFNPQSSNWKLENQQRDALNFINDRVADDDIVIVSDLDEIPNPAKIKSVNRNIKAIALTMNFYYYFMNCRSVGLDKRWNGCVISTGKYFKQTTPQLLRDVRNELPRIKNGGWHFSFLGGIEKIKYKIKSFAHQEYNKNEFLRDEQIYKALEKGLDIFNRDGVK